MHAKLQKLRGCGSEKCTVQKTVLSEPHLMLQDVILDMLDFMSWFFAIWGSLLIDHCPLCKIGANGGCFKAQTRLKTISSLPYVLLLLRRVRFSHNFL